MDHFVAEDLQAGGPAAAQQLQCGGCGLVAERYPYEEPVPLMGASRPWEAMPVQRNAKHNHQHQPCRCSWQAVGTCSKRPAPCASAGHPSGAPAVSDSPMGCSTHRGMKQNPDCSESLAKHVQSCSRWHDPICKRQELAGQLQLQMHAGGVPHAAHHSTICLLQVHKGPRTTPPGRLGAVAARQVCAAEPGVEGMQPPSQASDKSSRWQG